MSILESSLAPYLVLVVIVAVLGGFFRKTLIRMIFAVVGVTILLVLFNPLLLQYLNLILFLRRFLGLPGS